MRSPNPFRMLALKLLGELFIVLDVGEYLCPVIIVVSQGRIDLPQCQAGISITDLVRTHPPVLMTDCDVLHPDAVAVNSRFAAENLWGFYDVAVHLFIAH